MSHAIRGVVFPVALFPCQIVAFFVWPPPSVAGHFLLIATALSATSIGENANDERSGYPG